MLKTHSCGEIRESHIGQTVTLAGWVHRRRDHGNLIFLDLRDREGIVQVVVNPEVSPEAHQVAGQVRGEFVLQIVGEVNPRPEGTINALLPTGKVEVMARRVHIFNPAKTPPFSITEEGEVDELVRLRYRYLDLRRPRLRDNLLLRYRMIKFLRDFLDARGFVEVETPILLKSTPEGARDYLVPSRLYPGKFYALPQSPQQLKQLLMVAGLERYYQIARCFRDEDQRADRQPEFTQLDLEMSFVEAEDILALTEEMVTALVAKVAPSFRLIKPFPRISYQQCLDRFGTDKPDLRYGMELGDLSDLAAGTEFQVFRVALAAGGAVRGLAMPGGASYSRKQLEELTELARSRGAAGLVTIALEPGEGGFRSAAARFLTPELVKAMASRLGAKGGDLLLIVAGPRSVADASLGALRQELARRLGLADPDLLAFAFVLDFPLLEWRPEEKRWEPVHHPFTAPVPEDIPLLDSAPDKVRSQHYDLVCNGYELSSGSIRIHQSPLQEKIFSLLGYTYEEIQERFGHLLEAFQFGAPPHGGIAPGIDRLAMLLAREETIREVIAFPKSKSATDPMTGSPSPVAEAQLKELHLAILPEVGSPGKDSP